AGFLDEGVIRLRYSYDGPLKEDKDGRGKVKWAPAPRDCERFLGPWLEQRQGEGAGPEDLVFPRPDGRPPTKLFIERQWNRLRKTLGLELTWYQATRHSFTSRNMANGATLDEVSAALGHSSPVVTRRYYDHFVRKSFSDKMLSAIDGDDDEQQNR
ncbi:MAG: tyrosine-type recombinase/integrase, partial [Myxococcota bacterium]